MDNITLQIRFQFVEQWNIIIYLFHRNYLHKTEKLKCWNWTKAVLSMCKTHRAKSSKSKNWKWFKNAIKIWLWSQNLQKFQKLLNVLKNISYRKCRGPLPVVGKEVCRADFYNLVTRRGGLRFQDRI